MKHINILVSSLIIFVLMMLILNKAIKNGNFTCNDYILNIYLYISLAFSIIAFISMLFENYIEKYPNEIVNLFQKANKYMLISVIISFASLIGLFFVKDLYLTHLLWVIFILCMGVSIFPMYHILRSQQVFLKTTISVILLVLILTFIAFKKPEYISLSWGKGLQIALLCGIILQLVQLFIGSPSSKYNLFMSYGFLLLFSIFLLYDTKKLQIKAIDCQKIVDTLKVYPNYPKESLGIFLDILNLFTNMGRINSRH